MKLPIEPPFLPMEARIASNIPSGPEWEYEPKWDGFRCLAFRSGDEVELQSKAGQPLTRYFPEVVATLRALKPAKFVLDGEIILTVEGKLSFDDLLQRIHPAASRIEKLSRERPCQFVVFDLLVDEHGESLIARPLAERRQALEHFDGKYLAANETIGLSAMTREFGIAQQWLLQTRGQLDGVIAKRLDSSYQSGERAMIKVKTIRSADCVVGGFRYASGKRSVGSLLLGLYDGDVLNHVGFTSSMPAAGREELTAKSSRL